MSWRNIVAVQRILIELNENLFHMLSHSNEFRKNSQTMEGNSITKSFPFKLFQKIAEKELLKFIEFRKLNSVSS